MFTKMERKENIEISKQIFKLQWHNRRNKSIVEINEKGEYYPRKVTFVENEPKLFLVHEYLKNDDGSSVLQTSRLVQSKKNQKSCFDYINEDSTQNLRAYFIRYLLGHRTESFLLYDSLKRPYEMTLFFVKDSLKLKTYKRKFEEKYYRCDFDGEPAVSEFYEDGKTLKKIEHCMIFKDNPYMHCCTPLEYLSCHHFPKAGQPTIETFYRSGASMIKQYLEFDKYIRKNNEPNLIICNEDGSVLKKAQLRGFCNEFDFQVEPLGAQMCSACRDKSSLQAYASMNCVHIIFRGHYSEHEVWKKEEVRFCLFCRSQIK